MLPSNEVQRLAALDRYSTPSNTPEAALTDLAELARRACQMPVTWISFIDSERQRIVAGQGWPLEELPRSQSICAHVILQSDPLLISDLTLDPRFADLPSVMRPGGFRTYAGAPIVTPDGMAIGVVAALDTARQELPAGVGAALQIVARQVMNYLELRRHMSGLATAAVERQSMADQLRENEERYRQLFAAAQRQSQEQALLEKVRTMLSRAADRDKLFQAIVEAVADTFGYTLVSLYLRRGNVSQLQHQIGYTSVIHELPIESGILGRVMRTGTPVLVRDVTTEPEFVAAIDGIVSEICVPLFDDGKVAGTLNVESTHDLILTEADLDLLAAVADYASVALARTRLYAEARRQAQELSLLDTVRSAMVQYQDLPELYRTVLQAITESFGYSRGSFYSLSGDKLLLQHQTGHSDPVREVVIGDGLIGQVAATGQPRLTHDIIPDPVRRAAQLFVGGSIVVPVRDHDQIVGVLAVESNSMTGLGEADLTLMQALGGQIGLAIGRARLFAEAHRRSQLLAGLHETALDLLNRLELADLLSAIMSRAAQLVETTEGYIYLLDSDGQEMQIEVAIGNSAQFRGDRLRRGEGLAGRVWASGQPMVINDYANWAGHLARYSPNTLAAAALPLYSGGKLVGVLGMSHSRPGRSFGPEEMEVMGRFAQLASVALDNARLYTSAQQELAERVRVEATLHRQNQYLAVLYDMTLGLINRLDLSSLLESMIQRAAELAGTRHAFIYLVDQTEAVLEMRWGLGLHAQHIGVRLRQGEGLSGLVWQTGQTLALEDYSAWEQRSGQFDGVRVRAVAALPIRSSGQVVGVLGVSFGDEGRKFSAEEIESLERFAQLASLALDNARLYTAVQHELSERNRTEQALAATNVDLEQALMNAKQLAIASQAANRAKSEFLANMSHELRTPLSAVMGYGELLQATTLDGEQKEYLEQIRISSEALLGIISAVLDFSKIEAGHMEMERAEFDLYDSARQALYTMMPLAAAKKLRLTSDIGTDVPRFAVGDSARLRQVMLNLLSNAVKFTQQGQVLLRLACRRVTTDRMVLQGSVVDTGPGIPADKLKLIFEPFTQVDGSMTRRHGGTGLGLAIARQLVDMLDGEIWVESELGRGSTFHFTASFERPSGPLAGAEAERHAGGAASEERVRRSLRVLLAEDNVVNQRVIVRMLEKLGWDVDVVGDGRAAVAASGERDFDVVLMDIQMPEMDGLSATSAIRSRERQVGGHLPIVALTAYAMQGDRERCLMAGMDDYLSKPVRVDELQRSMDRLISYSPSRSIESRNSAGWE
jgi:GAF domain-containing protein/ActR/RegA family two-component response regulator